MPMRSEPQENLGAEGPDGAGAGFLAQIDIGSFRIEEIEPGAGEEKLPGPLPVTFWGTGPGLPASRQGTPSHAEPGGDISVGFRRPGLIPTVARRLKNEAVAARTITGCSQDLAHFRQFPAEASGPGHPGGFTQGDPAQVLSQPGSIVGYRGHNERRLVWLTA